MLDAEKIIERILESRPELSRDELHRMIRQKVAELGGLITEDAAAYMIARELGVELKDDGLVRRLETRIDDLRPGMRGLIVSGVVREARTNGDRIELLIEDRDGRRAIVRLPPGVEPPPPGVSVRVAGVRCVRASGLPVMELERGGRLTIRGAGEEARGRREELEGVIEKVIDLGPGRRSYAKLVIIRAGEELLTLKVYSFTASPLERLRPGLRVRVRARRRGGLLIADIDDVEELGAGEVSEEYRGPLTPSRLRPGLKLIDLVGRVAYVGMLKETEGGEPIRELLIEEDGAAVIVRLRGESARMIGDELKGVRVLVRNVSVLATERGLVARGGALASVEPLERLKRAEHPSEA